MMRLDEMKLKDITIDLINWIKDMMVSSGGSKAVIGISGGKDSSVTAALCARALGKENVIGIIMPDGEQSDLEDAVVCRFLDISHEVVNIQPMTESILNSLKSIDKSITPGVSTQTKLNIPPRVRMTLLYAISQSINDSRVINTSNISEDWIGYATIYGDTTGAFSPLGMLTSDEVIQVGEFVGLPDKFLVKKPSDGLTGKTDEEVFGFSYEILNKYIRQGICEDEFIKLRIDALHKYSRFKFVTIPLYNPSLPLMLNDTYPEIY